MKYERCLCGESLLVDAPNSFVRLVLSAFWRTHSGEDHGKAVQIESSSSPGAQRLVFIPPPKRRSVLESAFEPKATAPR